MTIFSTPWFLTLCIVFFASFIHGVVVFAFAIILSPMLLLILPPKLVVILAVILLSFVNIFNILMAPYLFRKLEWKRIILLLVGSLLGIPIGTSIIKVVAPSTLKVMMGVIIALFAVVLSRGFYLPPMRRNWFLGAIAGFLSGVLTTSTGLGGPPIVLFLYSQNLRKEVIYSNQIIFFVFIAFFSLASFWVEGLISKEIITIAISFLPAEIAGLYLGIEIFKRIKVTFFRQCAVALIMVTSIFAILSGLGLLHW